MKKLINFTGFSVIAVLLFGCSSMHPPTTEPYFPGFHARNIEDVEQDYDEWTEKQEIREERAAWQDSLMQRYYSNTPHTTYNFYNSYDRFSPRYRYYRPPHRGFSFSWRYSNYPGYYSPWYVDTWWADDYYWDSYYWNTRYYYPYNSYYYSHYYHSPYYWRDYNFGHYPYYGGGSGGDEDPMTLRPRNRDAFGRYIGGSNGTNSSSTYGSSASNSPAKPDSRNTTPAVIDRSGFRHLDSGEYEVNSVEERPVNRGFQHSRYSSDDDNSSSSRSSSSTSRSYGRSSSSGSSSSSSGSYGSSGSSSSSSRGSASSGSSRSSGSSSSGSSSGSRSRNRDR